MPMGNERGFMNAMGLEVDDVEPFETRMQLEVGEDAVPGRVTVLRGVALERLNTMR